MSDAKQWLREAAQRIAEHNDGTWCSKSWRIIADAFELVGDDPDGKLDLVAVMFDEINDIRQRLAAAEADSARLDWLESHPLTTEVVGGAQDGAESKAWAIACDARWTLREAIDAARAAEETEKNDG